MNWGSSWDDTANDWNSRVSVNVIKEETRPYSQILREHNEAAEASMKPVKAEFAIAVDWDKEAQTAVYIKQGDNILVTATEQIIDFPSGWNTLKLKVLRILNLAVIISGDPEDHCIIHVPTLTFFDNAIPDGEWKLDQLCLWAWKVQLTDRIYFKEMAKYDNSNYKDIDKAMLSNLQQYCLSIKVE